MAAIPDNTVEQVRERTDIVEVIGRYVPLKRAGRNYRASCPFHHEKTPSFMVSPDKQIYHCFGCGAGGNVFSFLMKYEKLEFPEAVRTLAERAGIDIPQWTQSSYSTSLAEKLHHINELAANYYQHNLIRHEQGKLPHQYLMKRGIRQEMVERFKLGYALRIVDGFVSFAKTKGLNEDILEKAGLILKRENGSCFDRFRHRIMFPIPDIKGKIRGFGGRILDEGSPKYMNSPETHVYNKGSHLYGLNLAWEHIRSQDQAVIVEGYLDLLTPFQHGFRNVVASLGTALTTDQIRLIKRFTKNIIVIFDPDKAGEQATIRSLDLIIQEDMNVMVGQLPAGFDPDNFINKHGKESFSELIKNARDLFDYKLGLLSSRFDPKDTNGKARIVEEMLPTIAKIKNAVLKSEYMKKLANFLAVDEESLRIELKKVKPDFGYDYRYRAEDIKSPLGTTITAERILTGLMVEDNSFISIVKQALSEADFKDPLIKKIVDNLFKLHKEGVSVNPSRLINLFQSEEMGECISGLVATNEDLVDKQKNLEDCIKWIQRNNLRERLKFIQDQIRIAENEGDHSKVVGLVTQYNELIKSF